MKKSRLLGAVCAVLFSLITVSANASLVGRLPITPGGTDYQAAYDDVLDITWVISTGFGVAIRLRHAGIDWGIKMQESGISA